jgi:hypothetical protein
MTALYINDVFALDSGSQRRANLGVQCSFVAQDNY